MKNAKRKSQNDNVKCKINFEFRKVDLSSKQTIKELFRKHGLRPKKRLGQNFLIDKGVLKKIIQAAELKSDDIVLEIGPGLGILTLELAKRVKKVIAVEKDRILCQVLKDTLKAQRINNVKVVNKDVLGLELKGYDAGIEVRLGKRSKNPNFLTPKPNWLLNLKTLNYKLVANLPYYITSPVIKKFLECNAALPRYMILMVQKEVAQRICAKPPKMNLLAVAVQFYAKPKIIGYVSKKSFWPQPKVDSAIIKIMPKPIPKINTEKFFKLVKYGFSSKRKFLINNLSRKLKIENCKLKIVFDRTKLGQKLRAENLSIEDWIKLFKMI